MLHFKAVEIHKIQILFQMPFKNYSPLSEQCIYVLPWTQSLFYLFIPTTRPVIYYLNV